MHYCQWQLRVACLMLVARSSGSLLVWLAWCCLLRRRPAARTDFSRAVITLATCSKGLCQCSANVCKKETAQACLISLAALQCCKRSRWKLLISASLTRQLSRLLLNCLEFQAGLTSVRVQNSAALYVRIKASSCKQRLFHADSLHQQHDHNRAAHGSHENVCSQGSLDSSSTSK